MKINEITKVKKFFFLAISVNLFFQNLIPKKLNTFLWCLFDGSSCKPARIEELVTVARYLARPAGGQLVTRPARGHQGSGDKGWGRQSGGYTDISGSSKHVYLKICRKFMRKDNCQLIVSARAWWKDDIWTMLL